MTHPESGPNTPDTTLHFQQLFDYMHTAKDHEQHALLTYIQADPHLNQLLRNYISEDVTIEDAIDLMTEVLTPEDDDEPHPFDIVLHQERELIELQLNDALLATGLQLSPPEAPLAGLHIQNLPTFVSSVRTIRLPEDEEARKHIQDGLSSVIVATLYSASLSVRRRDYDGYVRARGADQPSFLDVLGMSEEEIQAIDARLDPGQPFMQALIRNAMRLAGYLDAHKINKQRGEALRFLHIAANEGRLTEWAVAHDLGVFTQGRLVTERLALPANWQELIEFMSYLHEECPDSIFAQQLKRKIIREITEELDRPFDPNDPNEGVADSPALYTSIRQEDEENEGDEDEKDLGPIDELRILGKIHIVDESGPEFSTFDQSGHRIDLRNYVRHLLETARNDIQSVFPEEPPADHPGSSYETPTAASSADSPSVENIAAAILTQEIALYETEQVLGEQYEQITDLHGRLLHLFEGTSNPQATLVLLGLAEAVACFKRFQAASNAATRHFRRYPI